MQRSSYSVDIPRFHRGRRDGLNAVSLFFAYGIRGGFW